MTISDLLQLKMVKFNSLFKSHVVGIKKRYAVYGRKHKGAEFSKEPLFVSDSSKELICI